MHICTCSHFAVHYARACSLTMIIILPYATRWFLFITTICLFSLCPSLSLLLSLFSIFVFELYFMRLKCKSARFLQHLHTRKVQTRCYLIQKNIHTRYAGCGRRNSRGSSGLYYENVLNILRTTGFLTSNGPR